MTEIIGQIVYFWVEGKGKNQAHDWFLEYFKWPQKYYVCVESILKNIEKQNEDLSSYHTKIKTLGINYFGLFYVEIYVFDSDDNLKHTNNVCAYVCVSHSIVSDTL